MIPASLKFNRINSGNIAIIFARPAFQKPDRAVFYGLVYYGRHEHPVTVVRLYFPPLRLFRCHGLSLFPLRKGDNPEKLPGAFRLFVLGAFRVPGAELQLVEPLPGPGSGTAPDHSL
jgi:hypothetical protein